MKNTFFISLPTLLKTFFFKELCIWHWIVIGLIGKHGEKQAPWIHGNCCQVGVECGSIMP